MDSNFYIASFTAHELYWDRIWGARVYRYDPADDGPECETITRIRAFHPQADLDIEKSSLLWHAARQAVRRKFPMGVSFD